MTDSETPKIAAYYAVMKLPYIPVPGFPAVPPIRITKAKSPGQATRFVVSKLLARPDDTDRAIDFLKERYGGTDQYAVAIPEVEDLRAKESALATDIVARFNTSVEESVKLAREAMSVYLYGGKVPRARFSRRR